MFFLVMDMEYKTNIDKFTEPNIILKSLLYLIRLLVLSLEEERIHRLGQDYTKSSEYPSIQLSINSSFKRKYSSLN